MLKSFNTVIRWRSKSYTVPFTTRHLDSSCLQPCIVFSRSSRNKSYFIIFCQSDSIFPLMLFDCDEILLKICHFSRKKVNSTKILQNISLLNASKIVTIFDNILQSNFFKAEIELINRKKTKSAAHFRKITTKMFKALQYKIS